MKNKKRTILAVMILLTSIIMWQCINVDNVIPPEKSYQTPVNPTEPLPKKAWTYLFYNAADFTPGYDPSMDFSKEMYEHENAYVIMLRDVHADNTDQCNASLNLKPNDASAGIFRVMKEKVELQKELGEVNMGLSSTLSDFITYGKTYFPAERYILAFYDHGGGYSGSCADDTDNDWLGMYEKREAFEKAGGVDMIMFTAPCLMASIEAMYEVREYTDVFIGSENVSGFCYWFGSLIDIRDLLQNEPGMATIDLAAAIIKILDKYGCAMYDGRNTMTFSAVRSDRLDELVIIADELAAYFIGQEDVFGDILNKNYSRIQTYYEYNMDLDSLSLELKKSDTDPDLGNIVKRMRMALSAAVIAEIHGDHVSGSRGIALFCPKIEKGFFHFPSYDSTLFARETRWGELLRKYYENVPARTSARQILGEHECRTPFHLLPLGQNK